MRVQFESNLGLLGVFFSPKDKEDAIEIMKAIIEFYKVEREMDTTEIEHVLYLYESQSPTIQ